MKELILHESKVEFDNEVSETKLESRIKVSNKVLQKANLEVCDNKIIN